MSRCEARGTQPRAFTLNISRREEHNVPGKEDHMSVRRIVPLVGLVIAGLLLAPGTVMAQGVGNLAALPSQFSSATSPPTNWLVLQPTGGPIPVVRDPLGPPWAKTFTGPNGQPFQANPFQSVTLQEALTVAGNLPWGDWHADILNPNWSWTAPSILVNGAVPGGLSIVNTPGNAAQGGSLSFFFDPIAPGSTVIINTSLTYTGSPPAVFNGTLQVNQFPTPEPGTLVLLAGAALPGLKRRCRVVRMESRTV
jgi:hypothetical protein